MAQDKEAFLSRWSRRKLDADKDSPPEPREEQRQPKDGKPAESPPAQARASKKPAGAAAPATELPALDKLTSQSDFVEFMKPGVNDKLRRAALKKLFADPRFNVIDPLNIDIEDLSNLEKLSPEVAKTLAHAKRTLFGWDDEKKGEALAEEGTTEAAPQQSAQADETSGRNEHEGSQPRHEEQGQVQAGDDTQSDGRPQRPSKKG